MEALSSIQVTTYAAHNLNHVERKSKPIHCEENDSTVISGRVEVDIKMREFDALDILLEK